MEMREFSTAYRADLMWPYIGIPLILGGILGLAGVYLDRLIFTLSSSIFTGFAIWHWPFLNSRRIVLRLTDEGTDIDGIGHLPWDTINTVELIEKRRKNQTPSARATLRINLNSPLVECAKPFAPMFRPKWQRKLAKQVKPDTLHIEAGWLLDEQIEIANAFAWFIKNKK